SEKIEEAAGGSGSKLGTGGMLTKVHASRIAAEHGTNSVIAPDYAIILEATAIADMPDVPANSRVSDVGCGGTISIADKGSIYDPDFIQYALECGKRDNVACQVKRYVAGGNDARHIHQAADGVRCLTLSCPTRYIHGPSCVAAVDDYAAVRDLVISMLTHWGERA
ncbi:MAG: hypothetical protein IKL84_01175, partial [Clostridia bacterium]|nr:hypothetical protein [Clostridia bacterium]